MTGTARRIARSAIARALAPSAVTIVGASARSAHTRYLLDNLRRPACRFAGPIHLVNRSKAVIDGIQAVATTAELASDPGLVVLLIPSPQCLEALRGFRTRPEGVVVFAGGAEAGEGEAQEALRAWALGEGVPFFGPQSTGIASFRGGLMSLIAPLRAEPVAGDIALIMQSAGLLGGTLNSFFQRDLGLHTALSIGNAVVLPYDQLAVHLLEDPGVHALGLYVDAVAEADGLVDLARTGQRERKPVVLVVGGSSEAGSVAVRSHTGALATSRRVVEGVCAQYGVVLAADTDELVWSLEAVAQAGFRPPARGCVSLIASSGGAGIMAADVLSAYGVPLALPTEATRSAIVERRPVVTFNPFDAGAASVDSPDDLRWLVTTLAGDPTYSIVASIAAAGIPAEEGMAAHLRQSTTFVESVRSTGKLPFLAAPVVAGHGRSTRPSATWPGVPSAGGIKEAATKLRALWLWGDRPPFEEPATCPAALDDPVRSGAILTGAAARRVLADLPARWPRETLVPPAADAAEAIRGIRLPVVAKVEAGLAHRAVSGGVLRGIATPEAALAAVAYLRARFGATVALAEEVAHESEYVVGYQRDERYGPLLMFGAGGGDVGRDVEFRALPLSRAQAERLVRTRIPSDPERAAAVAAILALQEVALTRAWISSIDLNPIVLAGGEVVVLDAKVHATPTA